MSEPIHVLTLDPDQQVTAREVFLNYCKVQAGNLASRINQEGWGKRAVSRKSLDSLNEVIEFLEASTSGLASSINHSQAKHRLVYFTPAAMKHVVAAVGIFNPERDSTDQNAAAAAKRAFARFKVLVSTSSQFTYTAAEIRAASRE